MKKLVSILLILCAASASAETVNTHWGGSANLVYETGFMHMMKKTADGGVSLFDMDLVETDGPGAGKSEKGPS